MPKELQNKITINLTFPVRQKPNGVYEVRYRAHGYNIAVSSKDESKLKPKFIAALINSEPKEKAAQPNTEQANAARVCFSEYLEQYLEIAEKTTKPSTFKEYARLCAKNLLPAFGSRDVKEITRNELQKYLFGFLDEGKADKAKKLKTCLNGVFDIVADDFDIKSPMAKIVLPFHKGKKGTRFNRAEEKRLRDYCIQNPTCKSVSAILVMLYFGLRYSELATIQVVEDCGEQWLQVETSKERLGQDVVIRYIPFTPMVKKILPFIDFEVARNTKQRTIASTIKRQFPNHHPHELRYTFITNCKECGVNAEIVMMWDGHEEDDDVVASRVDRGYTDFSKEFQLQEAQKVDYII